MKRRVVLIVLGVALVALTVPEWRYRVVDRAGQPAARAFVREHWQNYSFETVGHEEDSRTDDAGFGVFPERRVTAPRWRRVFGPPWNGLMAGVHASYGPSAMTLPQHGGYEGWLDWRPGTPPPSELVLVYEIK
jgi:hypothetical protein